MGDDVPREADSAKPHLSPRQARRATSSSAWRGVPTSATTRRTRATSSTPMYMKERSRATQTHAGVGHDLVDDAAEASWMTHV